MKELIDLILTFDLKKIFAEPAENGLVKFFRYAFVGGIAFVVDYAVFAIFSLLLGDIKQSIAIATTAGFIGGLITNFVLSKKLVFTENARVGTTLEFVAYGIIGIIGCVINIVLMYGFTGGLNINKYIAKLVVSLIVLVYNYFARKIILYK